MLRAFGIVLVYFVMLAAWLAAGVFIVFAPRRFGNLIHENFGLFPPVAAHDWRKKLFLRLVGLGFLAFAARFLWGLRILF